MSWSVRDSSLVSLGGGSVAKCGEARGETWERVPLLPDTLPVWVGLAG